MGALKLNREQAALEQGRREELARQKVEAERTILARENATRNKDHSVPQQSSPHLRKAVGGTGFTIRGGVSGKVAPRRSYWVQPD